MPLRHFDRWTRRLLLAAALLLAQHAAALHAFGHAFERTGDGAPVHTAHLCCLAFQGIDDAPVALPATLTPHEDHPAATPPVPAQAPVAASPTPYLSRAPPHLT